MFNARALFTAVATLSAIVTMAQADGLVAYIPARPLERTADDARVGLVQGALNGKTEALFPADAERVDLLNARGNVERTYAANQLDRVDLGDLRKGTWTLRVHTPHGVLVRRFMALRKGAMVWALPQRVKRP